MATKPSQIMNPQKCAEIEPTYLVAKYVNNLGKPVGAYYPVADEVIFLETTQLVKETQADSDNGDSSDGLEETHPHSSSRCVFKIPKTKKVTRVIAMATDPDGVLNKVNEKLEPVGESVITRVVKKDKTIVKAKRVPLDAVSVMMGRFGENWQREITSLLDTLTPQELEYEKIKPNTFAKPSNYNGISEEWYNRISKRNKSVPALCINKIRCAIFTFSDPKFIGANVSIWRHGASESKKFTRTITRADKVNVYAAVIQEDPVNLPSGLYNIEVENLAIDSDDEWQWSSKVIKQTNRSYQLKEKLRFDISNLAGEFEIVNCDPITLEETLVQQFPVLYKDLVEKAYNKMGVLNLVGGGAQGNSDKGQDDGTTAANGNEKDGLDYITHNLEIAKTAANLTNGILGADSFNKKFWAYGAIVQAALPETSFARKSIDFVFNIHGYIDALKKVETELRVAELYAVLEDSALRRDVEKLIRGTWEDDLARSGMGNQRSTFGIPKKYLKAFDKAAGRLSAVADVFALANSIKAAVKASEVLSKQMDHMWEVAQDYHLQIHLDEFKNVENEESDEVNLNAVSYYDNTGKLHKQLKGWQKKAKALQVTIQFELGESELKKLDEAAINNVAGFLDEYPDTLAYIEGHACSIGTKADNLVLSEKRAQAMKDYLIKNKGIAEDRLVTQPMGESHPVNNNEGEDYEASRRVVISMDKKYRALSYAPSREGIVNMEKIRGCTVAKKCELDEAAIKLLDKASDVAAGVLMITPVPGARIAGAVILAVKEGVKLIQSALEWADGWLFDNYFENRRFLNEFLSASCANQHLMREELVNEDYKAMSGQLVEYEESDEIAAQALRLQFRLRAEALYGLIALMTHAAIKTDTPEQYADKLKEYKVQSYIQNYILNDGWEFPLNTSLYISMDEFWLYSINPEGYVDGKPDYGFGISENGLLLPQKVGLTMEEVADESDHLVNNIVLGQAYRMMLTDRQLPNNVKAQFASIFPVHHQATKNFNKLMQEFKTKYTELKNSDIYEFTMVYWRPQGYFKDSDWRTFDENLENDKSISPLDEIRVVIVLKDNFDGIERDSKLKKVDQEPYLNYPIYLQLVRTDGTDVRGPVYKGLTRTLTSEDLLESEKHLKDKQGFVFKPFYQFRSRTIAGTKPLVPESDLNGQSVDQYYEGGDLNDMCYLYMVTVGRLNAEASNPENNTTRVVRIQGEEDDYYNPDWSWIQGIVYQSFEYEYKVTLYKYRTKFVPILSKFKQVCPKPTIDESYEGKLSTEYGGEQILLNKAFLTSRTKIVNDVTVFPRGAHRVQLFMRFGGEGDYFLVAEEFDSIIYDNHNRKFAMERLDSALFLHQFDWDTPVEFIVVVVVPEIDKEICKKHKVDWRRVRFNAGLCEYAGQEPFGADDTNGPMLRNLRMDYVANVQRLNDKIIFFNDEVRIGSLDRHHKCLKPFVDQLQLLSEKQLWKACGFEDRYAEKNYSLYASYISSGYESLTGEEVKSIRPFGGGEKFYTVRGEKFGDQFEDLKKKFNPNISELYKELNEIFTENPDRNPFEIMGDLTSSNKEWVRYFRYGFNRFYTNGKGVNAKEDSLGAVVNIAAPPNMYENTPWIRVDNATNTKDAKNNPLLYEWVNNIEPKGKEEIAKHVDNWIENEPTSLRQAKRKLALNP